MKQKKVYPSNLFIRFLVFVLFTLFTRYYRVKKHLPKEVEKLSPPYLLLSNHVGFWDPFIAGHFIPHFTHFVSSDAVFRNPLLRFFLTRLGTIPKKKNMCDWFNWEEKALVNLVREKYSTGSEKPIFSDVKMEVFKNDAYRIAGIRPGVSALKWEVAVSTIWKEMGLTAKVVPYIRV